MNTANVSILHLQLDRLPGYADFLLTRKFDPFVKTLYRFSYELEIPLLKFFDSVPEEEMLKLSSETNTRLLDSIRKRTVPEFIEFTKMNWLKNQLPVISREDIIIEDISLINYARKRALREFLPSYTTDTAEILKIVDEIDRFIISLDTTMFKTYLGMQQERLQATNEQLSKREEQLLEAQALGKIGSFEWDLTGQGNSNYTPEVYKIFEIEQTSNLDVFIHDVHPDDQRKLKTAIEKSMHDGVYECEYRYQRNNIQKVLYSRGKVFFDKGAPVRMVGTVTDITERAVMVTRLMENEELSKQAQALTNTGSWKWMMEADLIEWSDEMYRIYGLSPQSEKITFQRFLGFIHEEDRMRRMAEISEAMKTGKASDYVMRINAGDGKAKVLKGKSQVLFDKSGTSTGMMGTCQDFTHEHRLTSELQTKNEELVRKNRDLESFNFIANHDLQEPLRKIQTFSNRILDEHDSSLPPRFLDYLNKISQASNRMQRMIEDFLVFYHAMNANEVQEELDLKKVVADACEELSAQIEAKGVKIHTGDLRNVVGTRSHILQMTKQLIGNAVKFSEPEKGAQIWISSKIERDADEKPFVVITVRDNGIGFDQKYAARIFELFQKLHSNDEYPGSGIGLSLAKKIIEDHGGRISVTSEVGSGSTFHVYLPVPSR